MLTLKVPKIILPMRGRDDLVQRTQCFIAQWSVLLNKELVRSDNLFVGDEVKTGFGV